MTNGAKVRKSKTEHIVDLLSTDAYTRTPVPELQHLSKQETKTLIIARFHMLDCGINFKNIMSPICNTCKKTDNDDHRLNFCTRYKDTNFFDDNEKVNFEDVYSSDINVLRNVINKKKFGILETHTIQC